jgi:hypothetical protein
MTNYVFLSALDHFITATGSVRLRPFHNGDGLERSNYLRPIALRLPERLVQRTPALGTEPRSPPILWDVYPALPKSIRLGEIEAADEREAIEKAAKKFQQTPAILIVMRRP